MLKKFSVTNYRQFNETLEFDLTASNYSFNQECVKDDLVKLALIYGKNGTGKSNLGRAIFDLVSHLTDNRVEKSNNFYLNIESKNQYANFRYEFEFIENGKIFEVIYDFEKDNKQTLISEKLLINGETVISYELGKQFTTSLNGTKNLNKTLNPNQNLSVLRYIFNNTNLHKKSHRNKIFITFMKYVNNILLFRNVIDDLSYTGYRIGNVNLREDIFTNGTLKDFEKFLNEKGLFFNLVPIKTLDGSSDIGIKFSDQTKPVPFFEIVSTGTKSLTIFYFWWKEIERQVIDEKIPLLFIDEFDCSYHFALSEKIVETLKNLPNTQVILTTHNTNLLSNEIIRPDCGYVINGKAIKSLNKLTNKELREVHNLERLYQAGEFSNG